ncbi:hypothetical protein [Ideonella sp.]|uniref:hypothetical protein n=1 Tax=Ideonella sp. TaxID=1929293 RepID=UPI002B485BA5|nr:hypothetical protein [Ideonella sp.]HJV72453.1 hypothetical protein [Ideonella sp.]
MAYYLKGTLKGALCSDCIEPLEGLVLKAYALAPGRDVAALAVARTKDTFEGVPDDERDAKAARLLAEATIDAAGNYTLDFSRAKGYQGEAFELDLYCTTVPRRKSQEGLPPPMQFMLTVVQPQWRQLRDDRVAAWDYTIPYRTWCGIRGRFGAWVICGQVRHCETKAPIGGVRVRAFDVDWLQDDALGDGVTDGTGHFRIDYLAADFKQTIFSPTINLEWTGGPDLYFKVETLSGTPLLAEPPSRGRASDRENAGPCFCVDLCLREQPPMPEPLPVFDALGGYLYASQIDSAVPGSGLTLGDHRAFYSTVRLNGVLPKTMNGQPMEYRFEFRTTDALGNAVGPWTPVATTQFAATVIGKVERYAPAFPGDPNPVKTANMVADPASPGAGPTNAAIVGGWVQVPQFANVFGPDGFFVPNGNMLNVMTPALVPQPALSMAGVIGGESSTAHGAALANNRHVALRMRVRVVGQPGTEADAGFCPHVAIENTVYNQVHKGGSWAPVDVSGQLCAASVDSLQLRAGGCAGLNAALDVVFTAAHPNLGAVSVSMNGPGGPYGFGMPAIPTPGDWFGQAINGAPPPAGGWTFAALPDCAYIVTLSVQVLLTTGDSVPLPVQDQIAFCKK